jgi:hypothetical protein
MAKKINVEEIDESFIVSSIRKNQIQTEIVPPPLSPLPASSSAKTEQPPENDLLTDPVKEESKKKRNKQDYEALFIRESNITARLGKTVYIRNEFHDRIQKIVRVIGENEVTLFSYLDNVIANHFEVFQDDIVRLYNQKHNGVF